MDFKALIEDPSVFHSFQNGEEKVFQIIYDALKYSIYTTARMIVGSNEDAEDIAVEAFALVWERRLTIESMDHLKNLLHVIARHSAITLLRNKSRSSYYGLDEILDQLDSNNTLEYTNDRIFADLVDELHVAMECMPRVRKIVFRMRYFEERPAEEVAAALHITKHAVYWHTKLALGQLRGMLAKNANSITEVGILALIFLNSATFFHSL